MMNDLDLAEAPMSVVKLHSKDHEEILNVIDQLRSEGISKYIDLPQLIVCGDQSSGKSSVLEAISGLDFPRKENLCTRFATELILRRAPREAVAVSIYPDDSRSAAEKERFRSFEPPSLKLENFADIVESAGDFIGVGKGGHVFAKDVLRVEIQSPGQHDLTLVDLPGLYHAPDESQDEKGVAFVESLVSSYMHNARSVILAVISAKSDIALQKVTAFTRKVDPDGERTMGIITKPDTLPKGSDMEQSFYQLAKNKRVKFRLGWHVLKNRSYEERDLTLDERFVSENHFLSEGIWAALPRHQVGIEFLRPRLSAVLRDHILSHLPGLIEEIKSTLKDGRGNLQRLGEARQTLTDQRRYLFNSSERFSSLINNAVNGVYYDPHFGDAMTEEGYEKRLRAVVQNRLVDFSDAMRERGESRKILDDDEIKEDSENEISRSSFVSEVRQRMRRSRGCELPGTFSPLIIGELFYIHAKPGIDITTSCFELLVSDLRKAVLLMLKDIVDDRSFDGLLRHIINPKFDELEAALRSKTMELLEPQQKGHPITYNHYFTDCVQKAREHHLRKSIRKKLNAFFPSTAFEQSSQSSQSYRETHGFDVNELVATLVTQTETDMETFACSEATDCMMAYYKVARKKFVDDFSNLAVEKCFLEPLSTMFSSRVVAMLEDSLVEDIAAEDESSRLERQRLEEKMSILQRSLQRLHNLDRHNFTLVAKADEQSPVKPLPYLEESLSRDDAVEEILRPDIVTDGMSRNGTPAKVSESLTEFGTALSTTKGKKKKKHSSASIWE